MFTAGTYFCCDTIPMWSNVVIRASSGRITSLAAHVQDGTFELGLTRTTMLGYGSSLAQALQGKRQEGLAPRASWLEGVHKSCCPPQTIWFEPVRFLSALTSRKSLTICYALRFATLGNAVSIPGSTPPGLRVRRASHHRNCRLSSSRIALLCILPEPNFAGFRNRSRVTTLCWGSPIEKRC
jgi:hypothetical protein